MQIWAIIIINHFTEQRENFPKIHTTNYITFLLLISNEHIFTLNPSRVVQGLARCLFFSNSAISRAIASSSSSSLLLKLHLSKWNETQFLNRNYHGLCILLISPSGESLSYFTAGMWRSNLNSESTILYFSSQQ